MARIFMVNLVLKDGILPMVSQEDEGQKPLPQLESHVPREVQADRNCHGQEVLGAALLRGLPNPKRHGMSLYIGIHIYICVIHISICTCRERERYMRIHPHIHT